VSQAFFEQVQRREEYEREHDPDAAFRQALTDKFPQLLAWTGKEPNLNPPKGEFPWH
jgi:hypothetical protein